MSENIIFVESSVIIAYCKGIKDIFNKGAVQLYKKLKQGRGKGIITKTVENQIIRKLNEIVADSLKKGKNKYANSVVYKRGKFLEILEDCSVGELEKFGKLQIVKGMIKNIPMGRLQEVMLKKHRRFFYPEESDLIIAAEALCLREDFKGTFYLASTDRISHTYLKKI